MINIIGKGIFYVLIVLVFAWLLLFPLTHICHGEVIVTKYTKIITVPQLYPTSDRILGRVDKCIEDIADKLEIKILKDTTLTTINVFPNKFYIHAICGEHTLACTWMPREGKTFFAPFMYFSQDTYADNILTHELIHMLLCYHNISFTDDRFTHEGIAEGLEDVLCK